MCIRSNDREEALLEPCSHKNARPISIGGSCTVEIVKDYCPDCGHWFNRRTEV